MASGVGATGSDVGASGVWVPTGGQRKARCGEQNVLHCPHLTTCLAQMLGRVCVKCHGSEIMLESHPHGDP